MRDLQPSDHGRRFSAYIHKNFVQGKVNYDRDNKQYYLCNDIQSGANEGNLLGYRYSYWVQSPTSSILNSCIIGDFKFINMTAKEIEEYKDFKKGDSLKRGYEKANVFEQLGVALFIQKNTKNYPIHVYSKEELYAAGWRLNATPEEEEKPVVELSVAEIAKKLGLSSEQLKVVDK